MKKLLSVLTSVLMALSIVAPIQAEENVVGISTEKEFIEAVSDNVTESIVLNNDIELNENVHINKEFVIDFNGNTITYDGVINEDKNGPAGLIDVETNGSLTIKGNGKITYNKAEDGGYMNSDSTGYCLRLQGNAYLKVENGTFDAGLTCIQAGDSSKAVIIDGVFRADFDWNSKYWLLNLIDKSDAVIEVYGGSFENFDPSASETENPKANFLGEGASCTKDGNVYVVTHIHNQETIIPAVSPTCTKDGLTEGKKCSICGEVTVAQELVPATGHHFDENGECVCGEKIEVYIPTIDLTKPAENVMVGTVSDGKDLLANEVSTIVNDVIEGNDITVISEATLSNLQEALKDESVITSEIVISSEESEIDENDITKVNEFVKSNDNIQAVAQYFDIQVVLKADGKSLGDVSVLSKPITFTVAIPEELAKEGRTFYVIRLHDGVVETLPTTLNDDGTISFETDKFSTYALAYSDKAEEVTDSNTTTKPNTTKPDTSDVAVPDTGVNETGMWMMQFAILASGVILVSVLRKKYSK